jgi:hypothetical protein
MTSDNRSYLGRQRSVLCSAWARDEHGAALCCILMKNHEGAHQWAPDTSRDTREPSLGDPDGIVPKRFRSTSRPKITDELQG